MTEQEKAKLEELLTSARNLVHKLEVVKHGVRTEYDPQTYYGFTDLKLGMEVADRYVQTNLLELNQELEQAHQSAGSIDYALGMRSYYSVLYLSSPEDPER